MTVRFRATVAYNGSVFWAPGFKWRTGCTIDLFYFPLDTQLCSVQFVNWQHGRDMLVFSLSSYGLMTNLMEENAQWEVVNQSAGTQIIMATPTVSVPLVEFSLTFRRKPLYYVFYVLLPCFTVSAISILVFLLHAEAGEKISLSVTVLLSYTIVLINVADVTPQNGETAPLISKLYRRRTQ